MITTDLNYPSQLPNALREGHDMQAVSPFIRTPLASGRARQRPLFESVPTVAQFNWIFTAVEARLFEAWFRDVIFNGAAWFNIEYRTPLGLTMCVARFTEMYSGPNLFPVNRFRISAPLEFWERPLLPPGSGEFPEFILHADIIDIATNEKWPEA